MEIVQLVPLLLPWLRKYENVCFESPYHEMDPTYIKGRIVTRNEFEWKQKASAMQDSVVLREENNFNPLTLEMDIYSLAHHLCKMWIFYEPRRVTLGNTRHFVEK